MSLLKGKSCKYIQFNDSVDDVAADFLKSHSTFENNRYTENNIVVVHTTKEFNDFIDLMKSDTTKKIIVLYESILMLQIDSFNNSTNIEKLKSVKDKLEYVIVCGNQHSLEYLWGSDAFTGMFL
jgi:hypothetical protein